MVEWVWSKGWYDTKSYFPHCPIATLLRSIQSPSDRLRIFKGGSGRSELLPAVSLPFFSIPHFWNPTLWFISTKHFAPVQMTELHLLPNTTNEMAAPRPTGLQPPQYWGLMGCFMVANLNTGIYAFLSSIVSSSLRLLCRLPAFHISEIIIRSCHISLQYLTFFFHSKAVLIANRLI